MSARGVAFLKEWTARNLGGPEQDSDRAKAARLAKRLVADAAVKGFTVADMNLDLIELADIANPRHEIPVPRFE